MSTSSMCNDCGKRMFRIFVCFCACFKCIHSLCVKVAESIHGGDAVKKLCIDKRFERGTAAISGTKQLAFCVPTVDELGLFEQEKNEKVNEYEVAAEDVHKFMRFVGGEGNAMRTMRS